MPNPAFVTQTLLDLSIKQRYFLMTACIVPRPIALVTSYDRKGKVLNAAPFSYFNGVSSDPPLIMLGLVAKPGADGLEYKDTTRNILESGEFVVNVCTGSMAEIVTRCSESLPADQSEVATLGLETIPSELVKPPRLALSPVHLECRFFEAIHVGRTLSTMVLGEVLRVHIREDLWKNDRLDVDALDPLSRIDAGRYGVLGRTFKA